jgi:hypothetical protein
MIYVIGLWTFLRAVLFGSAAVAIENLALCHHEGTLGPGLTVPAEDGHPTALRAAAYKMNDQGDNRHNQKNVNQAPRDMEYKPTKDPCDEQGHE